MTGKHRGFAVFMASACVSLVVLGTFLLLFLLYMKAVQAESIQQGVTARESYQPRENENLNLVLLGCREPELPPELILLFSYHAPEKTLYLVGIPSLTFCEQNGRADTLAGHYEYEGMRGLVNGISALFSLDADRYLRTQQKGLSNLVDYLGGVTCEVEQEERIGGEILYPGRQLLDGRRIINLVFAQDTGGMTDAKIQLDLAESLLRQSFKAPLAEKYDAFAEAIFYNCETNLSQYDFVARKKGFVQTLSEEALVIESHLLSGSYRRDYSAFLPDEASCRMIGQLLSGQEKNDLAPNSPAEGEIPLESHF